jgi:CheY-like chemotaxis protein
MARLGIAQTGQTVRPPAIAVPKLGVAGRSCGRCGSLDIRPSKSRNALDILLACLLLSPFRCRTCRERFYRVWRPSLLHSPEPPIAPMLLIPARRGVLNIGTISPRLLEPAPLLPGQPEFRPIGVNAPLAVLERLLAEPRSHGGRRPGPILILESDLSIRKLLRRLLERRGYLTVEIAKVEDVSTELGDRHTGLLVIDVSAGGAHAADTLLALALTHPNLRILALSAEPLTPAAEISDRFLALPKPFPLDRFIDCVDGLLTRPAEHR